MSFCDPRLTVRVHESCDGQDERWDAASSSSSRPCTEDRYCSNRLSPAPALRGPGEHTVLLRLFPTPALRGPGEHTVLLRLLSSAAGRSKPDSGMDISLRTGVSDRSRSFTDDCHSSTTWSWNTNTTRGFTARTLSVFLIVTRTCFQRNFTASSCTRLCSRSSSCCLHTLRNTPVTVK